jgi:hypothetical protein
MDARPSHHHHRNGVDNLYLMDFTVMRQPHGPGIPKSNAGSEDVAGSHSLRRRQIVIDTTNC